MPGTALVTGASAGLGAAIACELAVDGWSVAVNYFDACAADADAVVAGIAQRGGRAIAERFDITDSAELKRGVIRMRERLGPIDLIVNNAAGPHADLPLMEQGWDHYRRQLEFFVKAPLELLQSVLPDWRMRGVGRVINIGSEFADTGRPQLGHYTAAKGAMLSMTQSWARELAPDGHHRESRGAGLDPSRAARGKVA